MFSLLGVKDYIFAGIMVVVVAYVGVLKFENNSLTSQNTVLGEQILKKKKLSKKLKSSSGKRKRR